MPYPMEKVENGQIPKMRTPPPPPPKKKS